MFPPICLASLYGAKRFRVHAPMQFYPCNPSIAREGDRFRMLVREVNYKLEPGAISTDIHSGLFNTENWLAVLGSDLDVIEMARVDDSLARMDQRAAQGLEDARLFQWRGFWWFIASALAVGGARTTMALCRLEGAKVAEVKFIESPLGAPLEKNWMPRVDGEDLQFIYRLSPMAVMRFCGAELAFESIASSDEKNAKWSGSSQCIRYGQHWLCVVHRRVHQKKKEGFAYQHAFVELDDAFTLLRISEPWHFDEPTIEFCSGVCLTENDVVLSYGHMDCEARIARVSRRVVERLLNESLFSRFTLRVSQLVAFSGRASLRLPSPTVLAAP